MRRPLAVFCSPSRARPRRSRGGVQRARTKPLEELLDRGDPYQAFDIVAGYNLERTRRPGFAHCLPEVLVRCRASRGWSTIPGSRISRPMRMRSSPPTTIRTSWRACNRCTTTRARGTSALRPGGALRPCEDRRGAQGSGNAALAGPPPAGGAGARGQGIDRDLSAERRGEGRRGAARLSRRRGDAVRPPSARAQRGGASPPGTSRQADSRARGRSRRRGARSSPARSISTRRSRAGWDRGGCARRGTDYAWGISGVNYDEAFRSLMRGVARVASGHGAPD